MDGPARARPAGDRETDEDGADRTVHAVREMATQPRTLAAVGGAFLLILGVPIALFAYDGRWDAVAGLLGLFVLMVVATGYAFREAVEAQRVLDED